MQIVIDINDKVYGLLKYFEKGLGLNDKKDDSDDVKTALMRAVINGTSLPKGHWISHGEHCKNLGVMPSGLGAYKWCSNCDCSIDVREWHRNHYNYCPNCGAKMVEPQESEDMEYTE